MMQCVAPDLSWWMHDDFLEIAVEVAADTVLTHDEKLLTFDLELSRCVDWVKFVHPMLYDSEAEEGTIILETDEELPIAERDNRTKSVP